MKVLRTALLSTFLMLCFINVGHTQSSGAGTLPDPIGVGMHNMSMTVIDNNGQPQVLVEYDIICRQNSVTKIKCDRGLGLLRVFKQTISGSSAHISKIVDFRNANSIYVECELCNEDSSNCERIGCTLVVDP